MVLSAVAVFLVSVLVAVVLAVLLRRQVSLLAGRTIILTALWATLGWGLRGKRAGNCK